MSVRRTAAMTVITAVTILGVAACSSSDVAEQPTPAASQTEVASPSAEPMPSESVSSEVEADPKASAEAVDAEESYNITVPADGLFLFPYPSPLAFGDATADEWQWEMTYDDTMLVASPDVSSSGPVDASDLVIPEGIEGGQVWQAKGKAGATEVTYSYVDPETPEVRVVGTVTVTVE